MSPRLAFAIETAFEAARSTLADFQVPLHTEYKGDSTPVTRADRRAERLIRERIAERFPGETVLGEEEGLDGVTDRRWVVDPIDGTKSFVAGVPLYGTLLAYEEADVPGLGVAVFPALGDLVYAERGGGAYWNGRPCRVSGVDRLEDATIVHGSVATLRACARLEGYLSLVERTRVARTWGDAYGHVLVAPGRADVMIDPRVARWDISAVSVIVEEAGGRFTDFRGSPSLAEEAIATNGHLHDAVLEAFYR